MRLDLVVGPNGAGKSTFVELTLARLLPARTAFVNADEIAHQRWPGREAARAYDAARIAARARTALLDQARPFIAETVFSHASKLDLIDAAHARGYFVALHVLLIPEEQAVARVRYRVAAGGHAVPEEKIRSRWSRVWPLVGQAIRQTDTAVVYDNSRDSGPRELARYAGGAPVGAATWPAWAPTALTLLP